MTWKGNPYIGKSNGNYLALKRATRTALPPPSSSSSASQHPMPVTLVNSTEHFDGIVAAALHKLVVVFFWADFDEASKPGGQLANLCDSLAKKFSGRTQFLSVEAEAQEELSERFELSAVPTFAFMQGGGRGVLLDVLAGADAPAFSAKVAALVADFPAKSPDGPATASAASGASSGGTAAKSAQSSIEDGNKATAALDKRIGALINSSRVMLFMKGTQAEPKCKFSRKTVASLQKAGVTFGSFNILQDPDVRARIKVYSNWPTFPQLYVQGKLLGGADIVAEMEEENELATLATALPPVPPSNAAAPAPAAGPVSQESLDDRIKGLIASSRVMVFMKGTPDEPRCGFSRKMVALLRDNGCAEFGTFDILTDNAVRQGIKTYSNWPTFPQLYVRSKLIGGLDIVKELIEEDEFEEAMM